MTGGRKGGGVSKVKRVGRGEGGKGVGHWEGGGVVSGGRRGGGTRREERWGCHQGGESVRHREVGEG